MGRLDIVASIVIYIIETALSVWLGFVGTGSDFIPPIASDGPLPFMWPRAATPSKLTVPSLQSGNKAWFLIC